MIYKPNILLCCSSSAIILNSLYGYKINKINLCVLDSLSAVASLTYWLDTQNIYKRNSFEGLNEKFNLVLNAHHYL